MRCETRLPPKYDFVRPVHKPATTPPRPTTAGHKSKREAKQDNSGSLRRRCLRAHNNRRRGGNHSRRPKMLREGYRGKAKRRKIRRLSGRKLGNLM